MTVYLVGAGPGDPGLITLRALQLVQRCDCIIYDYLANPSLLAEVPAAAERLYVGKIGAAPDGRRPPAQDDERVRRATWKQADINQLLLEKARHHHCVVRLKGGDPFVFGRGAEEAEVLQQAGIPFEIVPGVTAGVAATAYAGIPVTHRKNASSVVFLTGREHPDKKRSAHDWDALAGIGTIVCYMSVSKLEEVSGELLARGRSPQTPVAMIQWGTYVSQRVLVADLATVADEARRQGIGSPSIIVIGEVVRCREQLAWFDKRPLFGRNIVVTRAREQASQLSQLLAEAGAEVIEWPLARFRADDQGLAAAIAALPESEYVAFTSANAVRFLTEELSRQGLDARAFRGQVAAVGEATAQALADFGIRADLVPAQADAGQLAAALQTAGARQVLLPQAGNARPVLRQALTGAGIVVQVETVYQSETLREVTLPRSDLDAVTFASAATVDRFCQATTADERAALIQRGCVFVAIGAQTAARVQGHQLPLAGTAEQASLPALVDAVIAALAPGEAS
jgi:uroporphyrinogen III methyltransferase / synthase